MVWPSLARILLAMSAGYLLRDGRLLAMGLALGALVVMELATWLNVKRPRKAA